MTFYPPLDTPKPLAPDLWIVDSAIAAGPLHIPIRMTALRQSDGGLWLHSPTPHSPGLQAALESLGPIRHLVAPDTVHWVNIGAWQRAAPGAIAWGAPGLAARLAGRKDAPRLDRGLGPDAPPDWAAEMEQALLTGRGFAEVAFHHRPSGTLILTDTVQAMEPARLPLATRCFACLVGAAGEGGAPFYLRWSMRSGAHRAGNRATIGRMLAWQPRRVLFAHGTPFEADATARLARAFTWALRP